MKYIIVGCGRAGAELARLLFERGHTVSVIDQRAEAFENVPNQTVVHKVEPPAARKAGRIVGEGAGAVPALVQALRSEAGVL